MSKQLPSSSFVVLLLVILVFVADVEFAKGYRCEIEFGKCVSGMDCDDRCRAAYPHDGQGHCDAFGVLTICKCVHNCEPPPAPPSPPTPPRRDCSGSGGVCSVSCWTNCCNAICAATYKNGIGFCVDIGGAPLCQCQYTCTSTI